MGDGHPLESPPQRGVFVTNSVLSNIMHVVKGGNLTRAIREDCLRCRLILKKTLAEMMGDVPLEKLIISLFRSMTVAYSKPTANMT